MAKIADQIKKELSGKKIVILGFGQEGQDNYRALRKLWPNQKIGIADQKLLTQFSTQEQRRLKGDGLAVKHLGPDYLLGLKSYDIVLKTPGIPDYLVQEHITARTNILTQTDIFFDFFPGLIIGITGTKGKGTTASLIYNILNRARLKARLVGNIGHPVFNVLLSAKPDDIAIYELSSHQLAHLKKSPQIAVFLNFFADHLDYYRGMDEYLKAKLNVLRFQGDNDFLVFNQDDAVVSKSSRQGRAQKIPFSQKQFAQISTIIRREDIPLRGDFNLMNVLAAIKVARLLGVKPAVIKQGIKSFKSLPHRLEFIGAFRGRHFYDDSMATVPETAQRAIEAMGVKLSAVILGGSRKGDIDFSALAETILKSPVQTLVLFPETGSEIWEQVVNIYQQKFSRRRKLPQAFYVFSMKEAVKVCYQQTIAGDICLLAPASASFSLFRNYKHRGELFQKYVKSFGQKTN